MTPLISAVASLALAASVVAAFAAYLKYWMTRPGGAHGDAGFANAACEVAGGTRGDG